MNPLWLFAAPACSDWNLVPIEQETSSPTTPLEPESDSLQIPMNELIATCLPPSIEVCPIDRSTGDYEENCVLDIENAQTSFVNTVEEELGVDYSAWVSGEVPFSILGWRHLSYPSADTTYFENYLHFMKGDVREMNGWNALQEELSNEGTSSSTTHIEAPALICSSIFRIDNLDEVTNETVNNCHYYESLRSELNYHVYSGYLYAYFERIAYYPTESSDTSLGIAHHDINNSDPPECSQDNYYRITNELGDDSILEYWSTEYIGDYLDDFHEFHDAHTDLTTDLAVDVVGENESGSPQSSVGLYYCINDTCYDR